MGVIDPGPKEEGKEPYMTPTVILRPSADVKHGAGTDLQNIGCSTMTDTVDNSSAT